MTDFTDAIIDSVGQISTAFNRVWNPDTLEFEWMQQPVIEGSPITVGTVDQGTGGSSAWKVDGSAVTQPVSLASVPLPTGASTAARQDTLLAELQLKADLTETQPVSAASLPLPSGASTAALQSTGNTGLTNLLTELQLKADLTETQPVSLASVPLPTGAATSAKQDTLQTATDAINAKVPALGQALAAASTPVVLTAAQIATLTPPAAITGFLTEADFDTKVGSLTEVAPATDTASSGLNGRLQRIAQRLTSLITALGSPFQAGGSIGNTSFGATQATAANLNATVVGTGTFAAQITGAVTASPVGASTLTDERLEVTAPGVPVQFPTVAAAEAMVIADPGNKSAVVIGNATVVADPIARRGVPLWPGDSAVFPVANLNKLYMDGRTRGDGVSYAVLA